MKVFELLELLLRGGDDLPGRRMVCFRRAPTRRTGSAAGSRRDAARRNSSCVACSSRIGDGEQAIGVERDPLVEPQLLLEASRAEAERAAGARRQVVLEVGDVRADRLRRLAWRRRPDRRARACRRAPPNARGRSVFDEPQRAAQALEADLDEDARADP